MSNRKLEMVKGVTLTFLFMVCASTALADSRSIRMLEAAENIEMASQQITKAYFYLNQGIRVEQSERDMASGLAAIEKDIRVLTKSRDKDQQRMVMFMSFTADEIKETAAQPYTQERGALMLDYSETLLEGAESLTKKYIHKKDKKEQMLIATQKMSFLLERATKYYIAFKDGFTDHNNVIQLENSIKDFEAYLKKIKAFKYPSEQKRAADKLAEYWPIAKGFYLGVEKSDFPLIVSITTKHLEKSLRVLERYHHDKVLGK